MKYKSILGFLAALLLVASSCSSDSSDDVETLEKVSLMLNWTPNAHHAGIYFAEGEGWYEDAGIDLEILEYSPNGVELAVSEGVADIGIAQSESLLAARNAGADVKAIASLLPVNDSSLMFLTSEKINSPKDLVGKTYGGFGGALETEIVSELVECDGGNPEKVNIGSAGDGAYLTGLDLDRFDFVWVFEGWDVLQAKSVEKVDVSTILFSDYQECIPNWYTPLIFTNSENVDNDITKKFLEITAKGYKAVKDNPDDAAKSFLEQVPETDTQLLTEAVNYYAPLFNAGDDWGKMDSETWANFGKFLVEADENISGDDPKLWEDAFTNDALLGNYFL